MKKNLLCLLLVVSLLASFCACGRTPEASAPPAEPPLEENAPEPAESSKPSEAPASPDTEMPSTTEASVLESEESMSEFVSLDLPLVEEPTEMRLWMALKPFLLAYNLEISETTFFREMAARTGITLDIESVAIFAASESFNLMIASGEYPDLIDSFQVFYTGSADSAIEQEIIVDLMDYMDEYMPNYQAALDSNDSFWMDSLTPAGALPSANMLFARDEGATIGMIIREDWLKDANMDVPETYDDMEQFLAYCKDAYGVGALGLNGYGQCLGVSAGLGVRDLDTSDVSKAAFLNKDGEVVFSPATEDYREYLELLVDWYQKGYIWPDFISQSNNMSSYLASGAFAACTTERDAIQNVTDMLQVDDPEAGFIGMRSLRKDPEEKLHISYFIESIIYGTAISATSAQPELAAQWLDYCYSPEGQLLTNYGVEGEGLTYDENGEPGYSDLVLHNENYGVTAACAIYSQYGGGMLCYGDRAFAGFSTRIQEAIDNWRYDDWEWIYPTKVTLTTQQGEEYTPIINELNSYVSEATLKFILGETVLNDSTWQNYLDTLEGMGLSRCLEIKTEALEAYLQNAK